jgi:hypothetical protein
MVLAGTAMIIGSVTPWASTKLVGHTVTVSGTQASKGLSVHYPTGWNTLAIGILVIVLGLLVAISRAAALRVAALLATLGAAGVAAWSLAVILHDESKFNSKFGSLVHVPKSAAGLIPHVATGYGLIVVVIAAGLAVLGGLADLRS